LITIPERNAGKFNDEIAIADQSMNSLKDTKNSEYQPQSKTDQLASPLPWVSVITPSYNHGQFIEETILSVKNQSYPHIEHIVIDGGSKDNTVELLRQYEPTYNIRWLSEKDHGQADAINKGFEMAQGDILCWLNSDDTYLSFDLLARIVLLFDDHPDVDVITGGAEFLDSQGQCLAPFGVAKDLVCHEYLRYAPYIIQPATFFRKRALGSITLDTSLHYAFDWVFFFQLTKGVQVLAKDEFWAGYRLSGENKTFTGGSRRVRELMEVTGRHLGKGSWQYAILTIYYLAFLFFEKLPQTPGNKLQNLLISLSRILNWRTGHKVANIL